MSQCTPPTFPFTSALPIPFNRPGLFERGEKSNAKKTGNLCSNFSQGWTCVFFLGKLEGGEKKMQISGEPMPIFFTVNLLNTFL